MTLSPRNSKKQSISGVSRTRSSDGEEVVQLPVSHLATRLYFYCPRAVLCTMRRGILGRMEEEREDGNLCAFSEMKALGYGGQLCISRL